MIGGKLDLSQRIKTKQVFIVFDDWKEVTSVEEKEGTFFWTILFQNHMDNWYINVFCNIYKLQSLNKPHVDSEVGEDS